MKMCTGCGQYDAEYCQHCAERLDKPYQGWANYETWAVHLWLTNDEVIVGQVCDFVKDGEDYEAAVVLKDYVEIEHCDYTMLEGGLAADLLGSALENVDWLELVQAFRK